jgi:hypothetical protein
LDVWLQVVVTIVLFPKPTFASTSLCLLRYGVVSHSVGFDKAKDAGHQIIELHQISEHEGEARGEALVGDEPERILKLLLTSLMTGSISHRSPLIPVMEKA